ncbi:MAG: hypothetical protein JWM36_3221 [Hyphomicrobiales bacterium]|nr:hypothetical protein [Hyphomicrobiales bacterium]
MTNEHVPYIEVRIRVGDEDAGYQLGRQVVRNVATVFGPEQRDGFAKALIIGVAEEVARRAGSENVVAELLALASVLTKYVKASPESFTDRPALN